MEQHLSCLKLESLEVNAVGADRQGYCMVWCGGVCGRGLQQDPGRLHTHLLHCVETRSQKADYYLFI